MKAATPTAILEALLRIGQALNSATSRQAALYLLVKAIADVIEVARCSVILIDEEDGAGRVLATYENPSLRELTIQLHKYPEIEAAVQTGQVVFVENVEGDERMSSVASLLQRMNIASILVIPIMFHERVLGTLFLRTSRLQRRFTRDELLFCETASRMAANFLLGLTRYQLLAEEKDKLAEQVLRDPLTGLYNQSSLYNVLRETLRQADRYSRSLSCLMIDIDNFKQINDRLGHEKGNLVLKGVATALTETLRKSDAAARYGGDEFGIVLPETDAEGALLKAERIRHAVSALDVSVGAPVTVSIGVATFPTSEGVTTAEDLIRTADHALYRAKALGKNRTVSADARTRRPSRPEEAA